MPQQDATEAYDLHGVFLRNSTDGWAVGTGGNLLHGSGSSWTPVASGTHHDFYAISGNRADAGIWAVGAQDMILFHP
jgi:hypothetical protein